jgi:hypothetical protein
VGLHEIVKGIRGRLNRFGNELPVKNNNMDQEYEERLKRIKGYAEEAAKRPLIHQGWVCSHPDVKKVWFTGNTSATLTDKCHIRL